MYKYNITIKDVTSGSIVKVKSENSGFYKQFGRVVDVNTQEELIRVYFDDIKTSVWIAPQMLEMIR